MHTYLKFQWARTISSQTHTNVHWCLSATLSIWIPRFTTHITSCLHYNQIVQYYHILSQTQYLNSQVFFNPPSSIKSPMKTSLFNKKLPNSPDPVIVPTPRFPLARNTTSLTTMLPWEAQSKFTMNHGWYKINSQSEVLTLFSNCCLTVYTSICVVVMIRV